MVIKNWINGSQLKNPDISGAIFTLSSSKLILNFQRVEGAKYVFNSFQLFVGNLFNNAYSYCEFSPSLQIHEDFKVLD